MRKILLTSVGVTALAVSANATDFTLSGTANIDIADDGNTSVDISTAIGVSETFDNGMVLSLSNSNMGNATELTITSDAIAVTFGDFDQNERNPGLNGNAAAADISGDGVHSGANAARKAAGGVHSNDGAISLGATVAGVSIGAAMNNEGDTMFGGSFATDMGGMAVTIGGDIMSDNTSVYDETVIGVSATMGSLVAVVNSVQREQDALICTQTGTGTDCDIMNYSAAYTAGGLVLGFQGNDNDMSSYSATYTIVPGMQFEIGSLDDGTNSTSSAQLQMSF